MCLGKFLREFASDKTTAILGSTSVVFVLTSVIFRMVHFWNSFLGNTIYEEEDCFKWTYCKDCGIYRWVRVYTRLYTFEHFSQINQSNSNIQYKCIDKRAQRTFMPKTNTVLHIKVNRMSIQGPCGHNDESSSIMSVQTWL